MTSVRNRIEPPSPWFGALRRRVSTLYPPANPEQIPSHAPQRRRARLCPVKLRDLPLPDLPWRVLAAGALIGVLTAVASAVDPGRLFEFAELKALNGQFNV